MLSITLAKFKSDITSKMKGTSLRQVGDFYATAAGAMARMMARVDLQESIRTVTMTTPFFDNINDYALVSDFKRMIDIRPQVNRQTQLGLSIYSETQPRQFLTRLDPNSFSIRYNSGVRTLRAQQLPQGNVVQLDSFDSSTANGLWVASGDASGLYTEVLNYVEGNGALGMNLSGVTGSSVITNSTAAIADLSAYLYEDSSTLFVWIPIGKSAYFTNFKLRRGSSASAYKEVTVTTKYDGTAFVDGWNMLRFDWANASTTGSPDNTLNTYRRLLMTTTIGQAINGVLVDNWTNALGQLSEIEYYSECGFRTAGGTWIYEPTLDTDLINVGPAAYEILKAEMMVDITQEIRTGTVRNQELGDWRMMLNGQPPNRYIKDPQYRGLYADYMNKFPSTAIVTAQINYDFDV